MRLLWEATRISFLPVKLQNPNKEIVGEMKSYTKLTYLGKEYSFEFETRPITKLFNTPNKFRVFENKNQEMATIIDPQWLREISIEIPNHGLFGMAPKISFVENYDIKLSGKKIGEFREQYFASSPKGYLDIDESESRNYPLIVSVLYRGLYNRLIS